MKLFLRISILRMQEHYLPKLTAVLKSLDQEQLWAHEGERANSVGGIILHINEQMVRRTLKYSGEAGEPGGISAFFPDEGLSPEHLLTRIQDSYASWEKVITGYLNGAGSGVPADMHDIYHLVEHTSYHLGQIIDRAQQLSGRSYQFVQNGINEKNLREKLDRLPPFQEG